MKRLLLLSLLFCAHIAQGQTENAAEDSLSKYELDELLNTNEYDVYPMDLNEDGVEDIVLSSLREFGEELYFFLKSEDGHYHCALKSWNFCIDGIRVIGDIVKEDGHIVIDTYFPDKGTHATNYYIKYDGKRWILDYTVYENYYWQEDYTRTIVCTIAQDIDMALITGTEDGVYPNTEPEDLYSNKDCKRVYSAESLDEFEQRFIQPQKSNVRFGKFKCPQFELEKQEFICRIT